VPSILDSSPSVLLTRLEGTAGLGAETVKHFAAHNPSHIYFSGRNVASGQALIKEVTMSNPAAALTFVQMDLASLQSIKEAVGKSFVHDRLDILMCNAGIMAQSTSLSKDGYEIQFATNHLGHALLIKLLLPTLLRTAEQPGADVRIVSDTSLGFRGHPRGGILFDQLKKADVGDIWLFGLGSWAGSWIRYGQSKVANILYAHELSRRYPNITSVSIHPGVVKTPLVNSQTLGNRIFIYVGTFLSRHPVLEPQQGAYSQVWAATSSKEKVRNGGFYMPVGIDGWNTVLDKTAKDEKIAAKLWEWTEGVLEKY
jgi:NAD(P)-dependent dehydrogenase (short-subunit alcohol dehydrogenase family)